MKPLGTKLHVTRAKMKLAWRMAYTHRVTSKDGEIREFFGRQIPSGESKSAAINMRVTPKQKKQYQEAADLLGLSMPDFFDMLFWFMVQSVGSVPEEDSADD